MQENAQQTKASHKPMPFRQEMAEAAKSGKKDTNVQLSPTRIQEASFRRNIWDAVVEPGTTLEQLLDQKFWAHKARDIKQGDRIEVRWDDGSAFAEFYVRACGPTWVQLHKLRFEKLETADIDAMETANSLFEVKWGGAHNKWRVLRKADGAVITSGLPTKEAAVLTMMEHQKTISTT